MIDQILDSFRKASEATIAGQQQLFTQWLSQFPPQFSPQSSQRFPPDWPGVAGSAPPLQADWVQSVQKQWLDSLGETLNRQRELLDASYRKGALLIEQALRVADVKSPDDYRRLAEELWRSFSDGLKEQADANVREYQKATQRWVDVAHNSAHNSAHDAAHDVAQTGRP